MKKKPKRSREEWRDIIFHKGSYVALAIGFIIFILSMIFSFRVVYMARGDIAFVIVPIIAIIILTLVLLIRIR